MLIMNFFLPPGPHELEVLYDGRQVGESPYTVNVNKPKVFIRDLQTIAYLGQKGTFKSKSALHNVAARHIPVIPCVMLWFSLMFFVCVCVCVFVQQYHAVLKS